MRRVVAGLGLAALLVGGCAGAAAAPSSIEKDSGFVPTRAELLEFAEHQLTGRCMRDLGFDYPAGSEPVRIHGATTPPFSYGISDIAWADQHGFTDPARSAAAQPAGERSTPSADEPAMSGPEQRRFTAALHGEGAGTVSVPLASGPTISANTDGCTARVKGQLYGDFATWFRLDVLVRHLPLDVRTRVRADPRFIQAMARWSACMESAGVPATSPDELRRRYTDQIGGVAQSAAEELGRAWAGSEARCVVESRLDEVGAELEAHHDVVVRAEHRLTIDRLDAMTAAAVTTARDLVAP